MELALICDSPSSSKMTRRTIACDKQTNKKAVNTVTNREMNHCSVWGKKWWFCENRVHSQWESTPNAFAKIRSEFFNLHDLWVKSVQFLWHITHFFLCRCIREFFGAEKSYCKMCFFLYLGGFRRILAWMRERAYTFFSSTAAFDCSYFPFSTWYSPENKRFWAHTTVFAFARL